MKGIPAGAAFRKAIRFVEKPDAETAAMYLATGRYFWNAGMFIWSVATFRDALQPFTAADLYVSENTLWKLLYKQTKKYFSDYDHMELSIVAFPFLRHFETLNIGRIYEGIRFGMRPQDVQEMLICS